MSTTVEIALETALLSGLNLGAVYVAAFVYGLNWTGILTVMVLASLATSSMTHFLMAKSFRTLLVQQGSKSEVIADGIGVLLVSLLTSLAVLVLLSYRFNLPMALGLSLISGILSTLLRRLIAKA